MRRRPLAAATIAFVLALAAPAAAASAPDAGRPFAPPALAEPQFAVTGPVERTVRAQDGTTLYTATWLPAPSGERVPPRQVPVVVQYSPYSRRGVPESAERMRLLVERGYAYTEAHVRGSGASGGCIEQTAQHEVSDGARIVEDAGGKAPWASGVVGMYGISYRGGTQVATATGPDRRRLRSLKAIVVGAPVASAYEFFHRDGVPHLAQAEANVLAYFGALSSPWASPEHAPERPGCQPQVLLGAAQPSGDYTDHYAARDHTRSLHRLRAATLMWHGHADTRVGPHMQTGLFDAIPADVPKHGLFGVFEHEHPDRFRAGTQGPRAGWERADWDAMVVAWYERHLRGRDNGVDAWPAAQVQGTDGQWRAARDWPREPGGARVALALGPDGALGGDRRPEGATTFREAGVPELTVDGFAYPPGTAAVFTTPPLGGRLELIGTPELDLRVVLDRPDAHIAVLVEALGPDGERTLPEARAIGARSAQHLARPGKGRFRQRAGRPAPVGTPVRVRVRLDPTDLVVPEGGRLRLTVTGSVQGFDGLDGLAEGLGAVVQGPTAPSGSATTVTVLHDCRHRSALRFTVPGPEQDLLDVRERDEATGTLGDDPPAPAPGVDGGGLARPDGDAGCR